MRVAVVALVVAIGLAGAGTVVALGTAQRNGLPTYTDGYARWTKLNRSPSRSRGRIRV